ncbi:MarR family winged helix-turn-helix transcriptional regulator [Pelagibacterium limicola]|uniref:MarR family winged helix-turn-helix transcriptional regulator n=1 Tax=Pelagibacterium limicola TaxID=2791022 RepID=UPI0018AFDB77|nr:MarR family winged helix-turn-helix transcriptional regulator [Pelagibacterium limicola]
MTGSGDALRVEETTSIIGYRLRRAQLAIFQQFLSTFETLNLRPAEFSVLVLIGNNPGRKQTEIAEVLGIKRANFVTLINRLDSRGLTERRVVPGNRRANALYLTPAGAGLLEEARRLQDAFETRCVEKLGGPEARDTLLDLLEKLCR